MHPHCTSVAVSTSHAVTRCVNAPQVYNKVLGKTIPKNQIMMQSLGKAYCKTFFKIMNLSQVDSTATHNQFLAHHGRWSPQGVALVLNSLVGK